MLPLPLHILYLGSCALPNTEGPLLYIIEISREKGAIRICYIASLEHNRKGKLCVVCVSTDKLSAFLIAYS